MTNTNGKTRNIELIPDAPQRLKEASGEQEPRETGLLSDRRSPAERVASFQKYLDFKDEVYYSKTEADLDEIARFLEDLDRARIRRRELLVAETSEA